MKDGVRLKSFELGKDITPFWFIVVVALNKAKVIVSASGAMTCVYARKDGVVMVKKNGEYISNSEFYDRESDYKIDVKRYREKMIAKEVQNAYETIKRDLD